MIYVLAYPQFEPSVAEAIVRFRTTHEPERAKLVPPHITLVFGLKNTQPPAFIASCEMVAQQVSKIAVDFTAHDVIYDPFEKTHKLFLVSSAGRDDLIALHQKLYEGPQRSELTLDIPYQPHMTVATSRDREIIERLDTAAIGSFPFLGTINALEVVELAGKTLHPLRTIHLGE